VSSGGGALGHRRLYLCTPERPDLLDFVEACVAGGVDVVQLREKALDDRALVRRAEQLVGLCRSLGVPFILNDRPDLALAAGADGVHVGQDDCPAAVARRILGPDALIGLSTHAPAELDAAETEPVDYLSAGPVTPTPTKPGRPGTGLAYLSYAAARAGRPFFVTGGVSPDTVGAMVDAGGRRFVVVRWLTEAADPEKAARRLAAALDEALAGAAPPERA
jgi:thiamine-phosphate pyrophosphorylase